MCSLHQDVHVTVCLSKYTARVFLFWVRAASERVKRLSSLLREGLRLVADDAVEIKRVSDKTLVGSSPEIIRHFVELRGIGIIDVKGNIRYRCG